MSIVRSVVDAVLTVLEEPELGERARAVLLSESRSLEAPKLLDRAALAKALACSPAALDRLRDEPGFPELRIGEAPRFELERVLEWLRARGTGEARGLRVIGGKGA